MLLSGEKKGWCFTCEFESLVLKAKDGHSPLSPSSIISHLESIGSNLGNGREEDAHEFLRYVFVSVEPVNVQVFLKFYVYICFPNSIGMLSTQCNPFA